ncbi:HlyD family efflux transporter periplasmic adaptor subunit [Hydrogenophilus islandicus]
MLRHDRTPIVRRRAQRFGLFAVALATIGLFATTPLAAAENQDKPAPWQRLKERLIERGWLRDRSLEKLPIGNGRLELRQYDIASKIPGRLTSVRVSEGDWVEKDQLLATLDSSELQAQREALEAQVTVAERAYAEAQAARRKAQADLDLARASFQRAQELRQQKFASEDQFDRARTAWVNAQTALDLADKRVALAAAQVDAAKAQLNVIDSKLADTQILSPIAGRVLKRYVLPGEVIPAGAMVLSLVDPLDLTIDIFLTPAQMADVQLGQAAEIVPEGWTAERGAIPARVVFVSPEAQFTPKFVETADERAKLSFRVRLAADREWLAQHRDALFGGLPAVARILVKEK